MATINWPTGLPVTLRLKGLKIEAVDPTIETDTDAGPKQKRRKYTAIEYHVDGTLVLTAAQTALLETFWEDTTYAGVSRFNWTHPRTFEGVTAQFRTPPKENSSDGARKIVALALRIWK